MAGLDAQIASGEALKRALVDAPVGRLDELEDACQHWHEGNRDLHEAVRTDDHATQQKDRKPGQDGYQR